MKRCRRDESLTITDSKDQNPQATNPGFEFQDQGNGTTVLNLKGAWTIGSTLPNIIRELKRYQSRTKVIRLCFSGNGLTNWDTRLVSILLHLINTCQKQDIETELQGLPDGIRRLIHMIPIIGQPSITYHQDQQKWSLLNLISSWTFKFREDLIDFFAFLGQTIISGSRFILGLATYRKRDLWVLFRECGLDALPIVTLINLLVGLIMAFAGAVQLQNFGAQIYVADLVTISMTREMGAIMTGIIMSGRTGAAFAAHLGTMTVNEEIDALRTFGFSPIEFLVIPRIIALVLMMPLLFLYAVLMGMLGGLIVGVGMLDLSIFQYLTETKLIFSFSDLGLGLFKSILFGLLVALAGCFRGLQSGKSASSVGLAATSAVVTAIVCIIAFDGILAVLFNILGL